jgi:glycosyltransferase involved in cell wall biosynthesis
MRYPRVLVLALGRINAADTSNNGLLLRNLFGRWPGENLAQIYSGGDNGDEGFFGRYYRLGPQDRRLGRLFYRLKAEAQGEMAEVNTVTASGKTSVASTASLRSLGKRLLMDTGLYELIFRPRLSREMLAWAENFRPDVIFAQGYNLTFTWLPMLLANSFQSPIVYYPTDDWSDNRYHPVLHPTPFVSRLTRYAVTTSSRRLVDAATVRLAFNRPMQEEYLKRYGKEFTTLMHGDDFSRFEAILPRRLATPDERWIVCTGNFDRHRWPLLGDLDQACEILNVKGLDVRATVFPVNLPSGTASPANDFRHVHFEPCPSHTGLVSFLRGADILFLPERFDETVKLIRLSVSSKAHLFMFSGRPIVVYSDPVTGIVRYAKEDGWAAVVDRRDPHLLADTFERLITDENERERLIAGAGCVAMKNHHLPIIQDSFCELLCSAIRSSG